MSSGCAFGESCMIGLEHKDLQEKNRFYQAIAMSDSFYITLSLKDYKEIMRAHEDQVLKSRYDFLRNNVNEVRALGTGALKRLCLEFREVSYPRGRVIYSEGQPSDYLYIV